MTDSTLYHGSLAFIGSITIIITIPILILILIVRTRAHHRNRLSVPYWLLAHRLQNYLSLLNLIEIILLLITFTIVRTDRYHVCTTQLSAESCQGLRGTWDAITAFLVIGSAICAMGCFAVYWYLAYCTTITRQRSQDILNNRPWALFIAHLLLQASAIATATCAFSTLFYNHPSDPHRALTTSMITGAIAISFFLLGVLFTSWAITRYHLTMRTLREEARALETGARARREVIRARYLMFAGRVNWGRAVEERLFWNPRHGRRLQQKMGIGLELLLGDVGRRGRETEVVIVEADESGSEFVQETD